MKLNSAARAEPRCPLCGGANDCAPACSGSLDTPCWCREVKVAPAARAALPASARDQACLCRACAEGRFPGAQAEAPAP